MKQTPELRNLLSQESAVRRLKEESCPRKTVSFYRYVKISRPRQLRDDLFVEWSLLGVLGRVYLAPEGINAQISLPKSNVENFIQKVEHRKVFKNMQFKWALEEGESFIKLSIKVKHQIVADGLTEGAYNMADIGTHLKPEEFHEVLEDSSVVVVDVRNHYESRIGFFEGAYRPNCDTFKEELPMIQEYLKGKEKKKILLYCTGGIRCEKASAFLKAKGFKNVYQLEGGIINYAHEMRERGIISRFKGKNFVFDGRLGERVTADIVSTCDQCGVACDEYTNCENEVCNLLFIQCALCKERQSGCCTEKCLLVKKLPPEARRKYRKLFGPTNEKLFRSRQRPELRRRAIIKQMGPELRRRAICDVVGYNLNIF